MERLGSIYTEIAQNFLPDQNFRTTGLFPKGGPEEPRQPGVNIGAPKSHSPLTSHPVYNSPHGTP